MGDQIKADAINLRATHAQWVIPRLVWLRDHGNGHPDGTTDKEWRAILDMMIRAFEFFAADTGEDTPDFVRPGLNLFAIWYPHLWD